MSLNGDESNLAEHLTSGTMLVDELYVSVTGLPEFDQAQHVSADQALQLSKVNFLTGKFTNKAHCCITLGLVAADIDGTLIDTEHERERQRFLESVAPQLYAAATLGHTLGFMTGNSMNQLISRLLKWLVDYLPLDTNWLSFLSQCHFFCNSGGIYVHIPDDDKELKQLVTSLNPKDKQAEIIFRAITKEVAPGKEELTIHSRFIDTVYIEHREIPEDHAEKIKTILQDALEHYVNDLTENWYSYEQNYNLQHNHICNNGILKDPYVDQRTVEYGTNRTATIQLTLKPVVNQRYAHSPSQIIGQDPRARLIEMIQKEIDQKGLCQYLARPSGRTSIDVTPKELNKGHALQFLIERLGLSLGQAPGANVIFFGDEVYPGGNDFPVLQIPEVLVVAVNANKDLIPEHPRVIIPSGTDGPDATAEMLQRLNHVTRDLLDTFNPSMEKQGTTIRTAIDAFKAQILATQMGLEVAALS